jgi:hypothetical protein
MTKMQTTLTSDDFDFIVAALNDASLEIAEKQEAQQEEIYNRIKVELQGVQQALQSSRTIPLRLCHWKHQNWEMSQLNSTESLTQSKLTFDEHRRKQHKPPRL